MSRGDTFGARFRAARLARGLSQDALADALGVTKAAVSQWELDNKSPRFDSWPAVFRELRTSLDELILGRPPEQAWAMAVSEPPAHPYAVKPPRVQRLVAMFEGLDDAQQRMLLEMAKLFASQNARHAEEIEDVHAEHDPRENYDPPRDD